MVAPWMLASSAEQMFLAGPEALQLQAGWIAMHVVAAATDSKKQGRLKLSDFIIDFDSTPKRQTAEQMQGILGAFTKTYERWQQSQT